MAREESDREDLMAEATALVERVEFRIEGEAKPVVAGFRRDGRLSLFVGPDPVFHFTPEGALRRAYVDGRLWKVEGDRLILLTRQRTPDQTALVRHEPTREEQTQLLAAAAARVERVRQALARGPVEIVGQVPPDAAVLPHVVEWLERLPQPLTTLAVASTR